MQSSNPVIDVQGLTKSFSGKKVLDGLSFSVSRGENLVVLGKSGQGKSVTLKCLTGMVEPDYGKITVFGQDIAALSESALKEMRKRIGFLFQGGALYDSMSVEDNLRFALQRVCGIRDKKRLAEKAAAALDAVGLSSAAGKMPSDLSGGMQKRVALARTLIVDPEIILYDEPTTGLDTITAREISELILEVQKSRNATSVIITHDMKCASIVADRVLVMKDGNYAAEGTFEELAGSPDPFVQSFFQ